MLRCLLDWYWAVLCAEQVDMLLSLSILGHLGTYLAFSKQYRITASNSAFVSTRSFIWGSVKTWLCSFTLPFSGNMQTQMPLILFTSRKWLTSFIWKHVEKAVILDVSGAVGFPLVRGFCSWKLRLYHVKLFLPTRTTKLTIRSSVHMIYII